VSRFISNQGEIFLVNYEVYVVMIKGKSPDSILFVIKAYISIVN